MRAVNSLPVLLGDWLPILVAPQCLALWSWWALANMAGGTLGLLLANVVTGTMILFLWRTPAEFVDGLGLLVGFLPLWVMQWLVLRRYLRAAGWSALAALKHNAGWVIASLVGAVVGSHLQSIAAVGLLSAVLLPHRDLEMLGVLVDAELFWTRSAGLFVLFGVVGGAQWLVLRRHTEWASFWIPASAVAGAASGMVALVIDAAMPVDGLLLAHIARWSLYGALTGIVLTFLMRNHVRHRLERRLEHLRRTVGATAGRMFHRSLGPNQVPQVAPDHQEGRATRRHRHQPLRQTLGA